MKESNESYIDLQRNDTKKEKSSEPSLREILANKENSDLFVELIKGNEKKELLLTQMISGEGVDEKGLESLNQSRNELLEILKTKKEMKELLTSEILTEITNQSPALKELADTIGIEGVLEVINRKSGEILIHNKDIKNNLKTLIEAQKAAEIRNKEIKDICKKYNVTEREIFEIKKSGKGLTDIITERRSFWQKTKDIFKKNEKIAGRVSELEAIINMKDLDKRKGMETILSDLDKALNSIGTNLSLSMSKNPEIKKAVASVLNFENLTDKSTETSYLEAKKAIPSNEDLEKDWAKHQKEYSNITNDQERDKFKEDYIAKKLSGVSGFFFVILKPIIEKMLKDIEGNKNKK